MARVTSPLTDRRLKRRYARAAGLDPTSSVLARPKFARGAARVTYESATGLSVDVAPKAAEGEKAPIAEMAKTTAQETPSRRRTED